MVFIATCFFLFFFLYKKRKLNKNRLDKVLGKSSELASTENFNISSQLILNNVVVGVDGIQRKLMLSRETNDFIDCEIIDMDHVKNCSVRKEFDAIGAGELQKNDLNPYVRTVTLDLELAHKLVHVPFYIRGKQGLHDLAVCESKAKDWQQMLNKMLLKQKRA
jgi:hypothetical protein